MGHRFLGALTRGPYRKFSGSRPPSRLRNRGLALPVLALLAALTVGLLFLLPVGLLQAQDSTTIEHMENDKNPVATFTATDPEGVTPITWDVLASDSTATLPSGFTATTDSADSAEFTIDEDDGMLKFAIGDDNDPPDFENPMGSVTDNTDCTPDTPDTNPCKNTYKVVVTASDGTVTGYHKVTVNVTNVAETGEVKWATAADGSTADDLSPLAQFAVGAQLTASVEDGDVAGATKTDVANPTWRWYRSTSKTSDGTMIEGANENTYTVTTTDVSMYLRAVTYYVVTGNVDQETASLTSDYPVVAERAGANELKFDPTAVNREVAEGKKGANVGAPVTATDNHGAVNYALGADGTGPDNGKFKVDKKTGQITTDVDLNYDMADADNCRDENFCTITITVTDASGDDVAAEAVVTIKVTDVDDKPTFVTADPDDNTDARAMKAIEVPENSTVLHGTEEDGYSATAEDDVTYEANDPESRGLTYRLMGPDGAKLFSLSNSRVLSFRDKPNYEKPTDANKDNVYEVTIRASDGKLHEDRMVKVTVTGADDAPEITGKDSISRRENDKDAVATFMATDPEGVTPITWDVLASDSRATLPSGFTATTDSADSAEFTIDEDDGMLKFAIGDDNDPPDFENPMGSVTDNTDCTPDTPDTNPCKNTYKVVVTASDGTVTGYHKVTVNVTNVAETGEVKWATAADGSTADDLSPLAQFAVGAQLTASVEDGDVAGATKTGVVNPTWRWKRGSSVISNETSNIYTVTTNDVGNRIRAEVTYNVGDSTKRETASLTSDHPVLAERAGANRLKFDPTAVNREVAEGKKGANVGAPVTATDNHGAVNYALGADGTGPDNGKFKVDKKTGQITTDVDLNYDMADADNCRDENFCTITITATDASGDDVAAEAVVTIKVTDVDDKPTFVTADPDDNTDARAMKAIEVPENSTVLHGTEEDGYSATAEDDVTYEATDPEGLNVNLTLMGDDGAKFSLSANDVLSFGDKPNYEKPTDANKDNVYEVTVRASDGTLHEDRMVKVTVMDMNEAPEIMEGGLGISGMSSVQREEGSSRAVATYTASGPNATSARWSLEAGGDSGDFSITSTGGVLTFGTAPNYETPMDANTDNTYMVTVKARDSEGNMAMRQVTVRVTNMEEDGVVTFWMDGADATTAAIVVGDELTAAAMDPDGNPGDAFPIAMNTTITSVDWQWAKHAMPTDGSMPADDSTGWMDIGTNAAYTVVAADENYYLRAMAMYADGEGSGKRKDAVTASAVAAEGTTGDPLLTEYDPDSDGVIEKADMRRAVANFFGSSPTLNRADMRRLVGIYFSR